MDDPTLHRLLGEIKFLLVAAVALLAGLVFGRGAYAEMQVAVVSFLLLGAVFAVRSLGADGE